MNSQHSGVQKLVKDLNKLHLKEPALSMYDFEEKGFEWIDGSDVEHSVISFMRKSKDEKDFIISVSNFTPVPLHDYKVGVPFEGVYQEIFNTDSSEYGGGDVLNEGDLVASDKGWNFRPYALNLTLPPVSTIYLKLKED